MNLNVSLETLISTDQNPTKTADQEIIDKVHKYCNMFEYTNVLI